MTRQQFLNLKPTDRVLFWEPDHFPACMFGWVCAQPEHYSPTQKMLRWIGESGRQVWDVDAAGVACLHLVSGLNLPSPTPQPGPISDSASGGASDSGGVDLSGYDKLKVAALELNRLYRGLAWFQAVGIGKGELVVYTKRRVKPGVVSGTIDGISVRAEYVGKIRPAVATRLLTGNGGGT